jgi:hypothetical protein
VFNRTVAEAGYDGYASRKLDDWTIAGDISDKFNRYSNASNHYISSFFCMSLWMTLHRGHIIE